MRKKIKLPRIIYDIRPRSRQLYSESEYRVDECLRLIKQMTDAEFDRVAMHVLVIIHKRKKKSHRGRTPADAESHQRIVDKLKVLTERESRN